MQSVYNIYLLKKILFERYSIVITQLWGGCTDSLRQITERRQTGSHRIVSFQTAHVPSILPWWGIWKKNEFLTCAPSSDINFKHRSSGDTHESWRPLHETDAVSEIAVSWWWPEGDNCSHICTLEAPWSLTEVSHCTLFIWMPSFHEKRAERSCGIPLSYSLNTVELDRRQIEAGVKFFCCRLKATRYMLQICATTNRLPARPHWSPLGKRGHSAVNNLME